MIAIRLHDSMTRGKREFIPADPKNLRMYVCGPTVYDRAHIGNARPAVVFDVLFRLLRHVYGEGHVAYVRNITDVEDKINARAAERYPDLAPGEGIARLTAETAGWFAQDMAALGCLRPTHEPRATDYVNAPAQPVDMVRLIATLIARGHAYAAEGHVLFDVPSFPDYGRLSGRSTEDMLAGARVEVAPYKRDPMDFVLWKPSTPEQPGWDSPWGRGRPGWHIECSAMSEALLGTEFDIHGGGADLTFPHHENEIAQSCCAHPGSRFAGLWMHNGMVKVDGRKMSKSLGNFFTVQDKLQAGMSGDAMRLALLATHYRGALDWTEARERECAVLITRWTDLIDSRPAASRDFAMQGSNPTERVKPAQEIVDALADDLNTTSAIAHLHRLANEAKEATNHGNEMLAKFHASLLLLGFDLKDKGQANQQELHRQTLMVVHGQKIIALLKARADARAAKDFARADAIRKALDAAGVVVMDRTGGPTEWELGPAFDAAALDGVAP